MRPMIMCQWHKKHAQYQLVKRKCLTEHSANYILYKAKFVVGTLIKLQGSLQTQLKQSIWKMQLLYSQTQVNSTAKKSVTCIRSVILTQISLSPLANDTSNTGSCDKIMTTLKPFKTFEERSTN